MIFLPLALLLGATPQYLVPGMVVGFPEFLGQLGIANLLLAIFNMIPAFPMDGGRVLRAILALGVGRLAATEIAGTVGFTLAAFLVIFGVYQTFVLHNNLIMFTLLFFFIMVLGQREVLATRQREYERRLEPMVVLPADAQVIDVGALPTRPNFSGFTWDSRNGSWVEWREGRPIHKIEIQPD
jgi:hypothetical protein